MAFKALDEFYDDTLPLPIGDKVYKVPAVSAKTGLALQKMLNLGMASVGGVALSEEDMASIELDDDAEKNLYRMVLGAVYEEMIADGVSWPRVRHAGMTAFMWAAASREAAEEFWNARPKAVKQPADRKKKSR